MMKKMTENKPKTYFLYAPMMHKSYIPIVRGEGMYLFDDKGNKYIDASSGQILVSLGNGNNEMAEILGKQAAELSFLNREVGTSPILEEAAEKLCKTTGEVFDKAYFSSGGSISIENAIKLARTYHFANGKPSKTKIIGRWLSYHGNTMATLACGGHIRRRTVFQPYLMDCPHIPPAYCYRCWFGKKPEMCNVECAKMLEKEILLQGADFVSTFIMEPISGSSLCCAFPKEEYYKEIRRICDNYDVLLIYDEVMSGMGRTGKWYGYQHTGVSPDILVVAKALTAGYFPSGAVLCKPFIHELIGRTIGIIPFGYSWAGNPLVASMVVKNIEIIKRDNLIENVAKMGIYLKDKLEKLKDTHPSIGDVRGIGLMLGMEFVKDRETKEPIENPHFGNVWDRKTPLFVEKLHKIALERYNLIIKNHTGNFGSSEVGDQLILGPYFRITKSEADEIVSKLGLALTDTEKGYSFFN